MCGIVGVVNKDNRPVAAHSLHKMNDILIHRGPDSGGVFIDNNVGLGHRRLSIIDLTTQADQPMRYLDSPFWIAFNGEIYNYRELKDELENKGFAFRTNSDTEVALAAYISWGEDCFNKFNGMWGMAIYDTRTRKILISRDRFGVKPLYYYQDSEKILFASEKKAIALSDFYHLSFDAKGLSTAIFEPFVLEASGNTEFNGVLSLPPGHLMSITDGRVSVRKWWSLDESLDTEVPQTFQERTEKFRYLFEDACRLRLRSDVPIATSLSGGLDSSSVVATLAKIGRNKHRTYAHSFEGTALDETEYAKIVAETTSTPISYVGIGGEDVSQQIDTILYYFESVYGGMPDSPYRIYKQQREDGYKISIDGHGADEMLGGYGWYLDEALKDVPIYNLRRMKEILDLKKEITANVKSRAGVDLVRLVYHRLPESIKEVVRPKGAFQEMTDIYSAGAIKIPDNFSNLKRALFKDFTSTVLPRILKNFDSMSMANSVEVRMPFLDFRLVCYSFSLPDSDLIDSGWSKYILRNSMKDTLDTRVNWRKDKRGFNTPIAEILSNELRDWAIYTIRHHDGELFNRKALEKEFNEKILHNKKWVDSLNFWKKLNAIRLVEIYKERKFHA